MDQENKMPPLDEQGGAKRKPPKLKTADRTISVALDNYSPAPKLHSINEPINSDLLPCIVGDESKPPLLKSPLQEITKSNIFFLETSTPGTSPRRTPTDYDNCHHHISSTKKYPLQRYDTLGIHSPATMYQMRKTLSFHSNEPAIDDGMLSRRTSSVRHSSAFPHDFEVLDDTMKSDEAAGGIILEPNRRSCRMHRSLNDPESRKTVSRKDQVVEPVPKCRSLGDDTDEVLLPDNIITRKLSPKLNPSADGSRSKSSNRQIVDDDVKLEIPVPSNLSKKHSINHHHKHQNSSSLDKEKGPYKFKRNLGTTHSFYLSPNPPDVQPTSLLRSSSNVDKRNHSASVRIRSYRDVVAKKSKSFINDPLPIEWTDSRGTLNRRDSKTQYSIEDFKRSPRLSIHNSILLPDPLSMLESSRKSPSIDISELGYEEIMRLYRRRSSLISMTSKLAQKNSNAKKSLENDENGDDDDEDTDSIRKRKKIVCIIVTVFLSLVFASVFVVVFTLTHSTETQVQNQTKKVYTFSRDRELPIHYNVRQENERLMQESLNRAKMAKNMTEPVPLIARHDIP